jgi:WD40 repeat protein
MLAVTFNPAGTTLATADQDGEGSFWDVATQRLRGPPLLVAGADDVAFSPDGKILAVAENGGVAALWEFQSCWKWGTWRGDHRLGYSYSLTLRGDGRRDSEENMTGGLPFRGCRLAVIRRAGC